MRDLFGDSPIAPPAPVSSETATSLRALRPAGGFSFIMADPAWSYEMRSAKGYEKAPQAHYDCMSLEDIAAMPVSEIAGPNCLLWLWAVNTMLDRALGVMAAWGFEYKTAGTWTKRTRHGKEHFGPGYLLRGSNEPFLIGTRGAPKVTKSTRSTVASYEGDVSGLEDWPNTTITIDTAVREHSRKPDEAYAAAEALMPGARRLDLFSRTNRPGWVSWGNEAGKFDV